MYSDNRRYPDNILKLILNFEKYRSFFKKPLTKSPACDIFSNSGWNTAAIAELCNGSTTDSDSVCLGSNPSSAARKKRASHRLALFFQLYSPLASYMHFVRDIAFGSDMRFARWKLQGEYNITAERSGAIEFALKKICLGMVSS